MKYLVLFLLSITCLSVNAQDFKFRGKTEKIENRYFTLGKDDPDKTDESDKKVSISFDGTQLLIGKETYKYMWHQLSREDDTIQLNCIERREEGEFPYIDAKFEIDFLSDLEIKLTQFKPTSATTYTETTYSIGVIKTTN